MQSRRFRVLKRLCGWLIRPQIAGELPKADAGNLLYVLARPSVSDLAVLSTVAQRLDLPDPEAFLYCDNSLRQFDFLSQNIGWPLHRSLMRHYPPGLERAHELAERGQPIKLVAVTVFWSRAPKREASLASILMSERWTPTGTLKRLLQMFFNRKLVFLRFAPAIDLPTLIESCPDPQRSLRRTARLLRVIFRNQRLAFIGPELSLKRRALANVLKHPQVRLAIERDALANNQQLRVSGRRAHRSLQRIVSDFSPVTLRWVYGLVTWCWKRAGVKFHIEGIEATRQHAETADVVYLPCHQSHLDYVVLSFLLYEHGLALPHIAAGNNLNLPLLGSLLRQCGAFFIRRSFRDDDLYRHIVTGYLRLILSRGHPLEFFLEGGRTRTGFLMPARLGMLQVTLGAAKAPPARPLALIPVRLSYQRLLDGESHASELGGAFKQQESWGDLARGFFRMGAGLGRIGVSFGEPFVIERSQPVQSPEVATQVLRRINARLLASATHLLALVMLSVPGRRLERGMLESQLAHYIDWLGSDGFVTMEADADACIATCQRQGLIEFRTFAGVHLVHCTAKGHRLLPWHRNNALHSLAAPSLLARRAISGGLEEKLTPRTLMLWRLIACELHLPEPDETTCRKWRQRLCDCGWIQEHGTAASGVSEPGRHLKLLARLLVPTLERHLLVLLTAIKGQSTQPCTREELIPECLRRGAHLCESLSEPMPRDALRLALYSLERTGVLIEQPDGVYAAEDADSLVSAIADCLPEESVDALVSERDVRSPGAAL